MEITKEIIIEAANKCEAAKETLRTLFPECFEEEINLEKCTGIGNRELFKSNGVAYDSMIAVRGPKCFYLSNAFEWEIEQREGYKVLIPLQLKP